MTLGDIEILASIIGTACIVIGAVYFVLKKWFVATDTYEKDKEELEDNIDKKIEIFAKEKIDQKDFQRQEEKLKDMNKIISETTKNVSELSYTVKSLEQNNISLSTSFKEFKHEINKKLDMIQEDINEGKDTNCNIQIQMERIITILDRGED